MPTLEDALIRGDYVPVGKEEHHRIAAALAARKKDAVLNIRMNKGDFESLKHKAKRLGVQYQTFISQAPPQNRPCLIISKNN